MATSTSSRTSDRAAAIPARAPWASIRNMTYTSRLDTLHMASTLTRADRSEPADSYTHPAPADPRQGRVLVTGATGFAGSAMLRALVGARYKVRALVRDRSHARALELAGVEVAVGNMKDSGSLASARARRVDGLPLRIDFPPGGTSRRGVRIGERRGTVAAHHRGGGCGCESRGPHQHRRRARRHRASARHRRVALRPGRHLSEHEARGRAEGRRHRDATRRSAHRRAPRANVRAARPAAAQDVQGRRAPALPDPRQRRRAVQHGAHR